MELRPFRDAGFGRMEWGLSIQVSYSSDHFAGGADDRQDCLYGVDKAMNEGLLDLEHFDLRSYRYYEIPKSAITSI